jgi:hypothetical protein
MSRSRSVLRISHFAMPVLIWHKERRAVGLECGRQCGLVRYKRKPRYINTSLSPSLVWAAFLPLLSSVDFRYRGEQFHRCDFHAAHTALQPYAQRRSVSPSLVWPLDSPARTSALQPASVSLTLRRLRLNSERIHRVTSWRPGRPEYNSPWWVNHGRRPAGSRAAGTAIGGPATLSELQSLHRSDAAT